MNFDNYALPDIGYEFKPKKYTFKAVCISDVCNELRLDGLVKTRSEKKVKKTAIDCPDCGHVLLWERTEINV